MTGMNLFLSSYFKEAAKPFLEFTSGTCAGKKACFIPTASVPEKLTFYVGADRAALKTLGMAVEDLEISKQPYEAIRDSIGGADYVFVAGGNTFFLLQELRRSGADKLIKKHIDKGKLYIGSSAGSIITASDIGYAAFMDSPKAAPELNGDFSALSATPFSIVPHAANAPFKKAVGKIIAAYGESLDLRPISNNQAVAVSDGVVTLITA